MTHTVTVGARVPESWTSDADEMGISSSEYVRRMARAGRRQWGYEHNDEPAKPKVNLQDRAGDPSDDAASVLEDTIVRNLATSDGVSEETLVDYVVDDLESQINDILESLKQDGEVDYVPSKGGWVKH